VSVVALGMRSMHIPATITKTYTKKKYTNKEIEQMESITRQKKISRVAHTSVWLGGIQCSIRPFHLTAGDTKCFLFFFCTVPFNQVKISIFIHSIN